MQGLAVIEMNRKVYNYKVISKLCFDSSFNNTSTQVTPENI